MFDHFIYQSVFNSAPIAECLVSPSLEATILAVNDAFLKASSRSRDELIGKSLFAAFPGNPDDTQDTGVAAMQRSLAHVIATEEPDFVALQRYPITVQFADGSKRYEERFWSIFNFPIFDAQGRLAGISRRTIDVTENKHAEDVAQQQAARQAFQLALADHIRPLADPDEVIAAACGLLGKQLGVARVMYAEVDDAGEAVMIKSGWDDGTLPSISGALLRLDDFGPLITRTLHAGESLVIADVTNDPRSAAHADAYAEISVRACLVIPLMKEGRLRALLNLHDSRIHAWASEEVALATDMMDRTWASVESARAQAELRAERDQTQYIFDSMAEGFATLDRHWTILRMNAEGLRLTQRSAAEVVGRNHWDVFPDLKGTDTEVIYRRVMETGKAEITEFAHVQPDKTHAWSEVRAHPSLDGGIAFFFRDISERKETQEKLQDADRRKDEFLAMLAHELRNPLAPIGAAAELLQAVKLDEERVRKTSQIISRQVNHMTSLVDDLLDVSRVTRGLVKLDKEPLDIRQLITDAIEQVTPLIRSRHHHLALHLTPDATTVLGDRKRLVQVVANLLNNAAKYTHEDGTIVLTTDVCDSRVQIEISDNGIGMAPQLVSRAFDLFTQEERTSDRSSGGLGLGLALVKSLTELHHGAVTCESAGIGKGSKFTLYLPRLLIKDRHGEPQYKDDGMQKKTQPLRIMVVDDNMDAASMLAMLLEASGHHVLVEHRSHQALERAGAEAPHVCLLDIGLPGMDGNELAQRLRAQPATAKSVLIAITGYGQESDRKRTLVSGFDHHLVKPVDTAKLAAILAGIRKN